MSQEVYRVLDLRDSYYLSIPAWNPKPFDWEGIECFTHLKPDDEAANVYGASERTTGASLTSHTGWWYDSHEAAQRAAISILSTRGRELTLQRIAATLREIQTDERGAWMNSPGNKGS